MVAAQLSRNDGQFGVVLVTSCQPMKITLVRSLLVGGLLSFLRKGYTIWKINIVRDRNVVLCSTKYFFNDTYVNI